jgi:FMN reductase
VTVLAVNASPSAHSRTAALARAAVAVGGGGEILHLGEIGADGLLGRVTDPAMAAALDSMRAADRLVLVTPVYRATYAGLLKVVLDQLGEGDLAGGAVVLAATAGCREHFLSLDAGLRPVVTTLGAWIAPQVVYASRESFDADLRPDRRVLDDLATALDQATLLVRVATG